MPLKFPLNIYCCHADVTSIMCPYSLDAMKAISIPIPKMYKEQDELLIGFIQKLSEELPEEQRSTFIYIENDVLNAANNETNVYCDDEFRSLAVQIRAQPTAELFDVLALNCYTCLVNYIPDALLPFNFLDSSLEYPALDAFLRYLNNYCGYKRGMQDGRKSIKPLIEFLRKHYSYSKQNVLRVIFMMARFLTVSEIVNGAPFEFAFECIKDIEMVTKTERIYKPAVNLMFGAIGCMLLTLKKYDMVVYNRYCGTVKRLVGSFDEVDVPCVKEVIELIGWKKAGGDEDLY